MTRFKGNYAISLSHDGHPANISRSTEAQEVLKKYGISIVEAEDDDMGAYLTRLPIHLAKVIDDGGSFKLTIPYKESYFEIDCESP